MRAVWAEDAWFEPLCGLSIYGRNPRLVSRVSRQGRISTIAFSGFVFESVTRSHRELIGLRRILVHGGSG